MPITRAVMALTERLLDAFEKHFVSRARSGEDVQDGEGALSLDPHSTNAAITLAMVIRPRTSPL